MVAAVAVRDGRYLIARRPAHKRHAGAWEFPGGKVREGESPAEALARELSEELGLRMVGGGRVLGRTRDPGTPFEIAFVEAQVDGEPVATEHDRVGWFALDDLAAARLAPADREFVRSVLSASGCP